MGALRQGQERLTRLENSPKSATSTLWSGALLLSFSLLAACATPETAEKPEPLKRTHYTLELGDTHKNHPPLPAETEILVKSYFQNGTASAPVPGFRGWDFNGDGRFEMVEVLNQDGTVQTRVFDFDGDGRIDAVRESDAAELTLSGDTH